MQENKIEVPPEKRCIWRAVDSDDLFTPIICSKCATIIQIDPDDGIIGDFIQEERFHTCPSHEADNPDNPDNLDNPETEND